MVHQSQNLISHWKSMSKFINEKSDDNVSIDKNENDQSEYNTNEGDEPMMSASASEYLMESEKILSSSSSSSSISLADTQHDDSTVVKSNTEKDILERHRIHMNGNNGRYRSKMGPKLYRQETLRIEQQRRGSSTENDSVMLLVDEYTEAWHVLKKCCKDYDENSIQELVLVASVSPLPPEYLCFEHWKSSRAWKDPMPSLNEEKSNSSVNRCEVRADRLDFSTMNASMDMDTEVIEPGLLSRYLAVADKVSTNSNDELSPLESSIEFKQIFSDSMNTQRAVLRFVKTISKHETLLRSRDEIKERLQYMTEDAWEEYSIRKNQYFPISEHNLNLAVDVQWFITQGKGGPPLVLTGELSGEENSDDEEYYDENYEAQRYTANLERETDEGYMRNSLITKALHTTVVMKGFLLAKNKQDFSVWKRVWCVLIDGELWKISRMRQSTFMIINDKRKRRYIWRSKHVKIRLLHVSVSEPAQDSPNIHVPFAFEIRTMQGDCHVFKTSSRQDQVRWIKAISKEIVKNHENTFTEMAELIISDV